MSEPGAATRVDAAPALARIPEADDDIDAAVWLLGLVALAGPLVVTLMACGTIWARRSPLPALLGHVPLTALFALTCGLMDRRPWAWWTTAASAAALVVASGAAMLVRPGGLCLIGPPAAVLAITALALQRRRDRPARRAPPRGGAPSPGGRVAFWATYQALCLLVVGIMGTQHLVRFEVGLPIGGPATLVLTLAGSVAGALVVAIAVGLHRRARRRSLRDPERLGATTRARVVALRREGRSLREIADALAAEGHASPEGPKLSPWLLRHVLRAEPRRPAA